MITKVDTPPLTTVVFPLVRVALVLRSKVLEWANVDNEAIKTIKKILSKIFFLIGSPLESGGGRPPTQALIKNQITGRKYLLRLPLSL